MSGKTPERPSGDRSGKHTCAEAREARLKVALKANMARRKAQARARAGQKDSGRDPHDKNEG